MNQSINSDKLPEQQIHSYFKQAALNQDDFDQKHDYTWGNLKFGHYRHSGPKSRPQPYFYPIEWEGYGLNVAGIYGTNENWLMKDNNEEEWYVMYYGTTFQEVQYIMQGGRKIMPSCAQAYSNDSCLITKQKIGQGVYFSNHIEVCERYGNMKPTKIGDQEYIVVLQVRVRPEALRQVKKQSEILDLIVQHKMNNKNYDKSLDNMELWNNDYFVVNGTENIRPYRILLKKLLNTQIT